MTSSVYESTVVAYYSHTEVQEEIARFSTDRWVALHCELLDKEGRPYLLRYRRVAKNKIPLTIKNPEDVPALLERFGRLRPRTFYASANVYEKITHREHVRSKDNISFCLPTWDIDNTIQKWRATIAVAEEIVNLLEEENVSKSVFLKWSGNGVHVHIHHKAFSAELLRKINPLDAAYAIVEYVNSKLRSRYLEIAKRYGAQELKVENEMDPQRVFTCPLSLHRSQNLVAVCLPPDMVSDFNPEWASSEHYRHWSRWERFEKGESDQLAKKGRRTVGPYPLRGVPRPTERRGKSTAKLITRWLERKNEADLQA